MNKHDLKRQQDLISAILKAKEKAQIAALYLIANDRDMDDIANVELAAEHINIALSHLGVETEGEAECTSS